jgi:hypothetical protein
MRTFSPSFLFTSQVGKDIYFTPCTCLRVKHTVHDTRRKCTVSASTTNAFFRKIFTKTCGKSCLPPRAQYRILRVSQVRCIDALEREVSRLRPETCSRNLYSDPSEVLSYLAKKRKKIIAPFMDVDLIANKRGEWRSANKQGRSIRI